MTMRITHFQNPKREHTAASPLEEPSPKKVKTQTPAEGVSDKASVSVEYAKSGRSTCKGCSENIAKGTLCVGTSFHDPRGFENTKWYHVACFPTSSYPVFPVENLKGFYSVEVCAFMLQASHLLSLCILIFRFGIYVGP
jgi:bifunctional polynucleotide phosphatase/kinase